MKTIITSIIFLLAFNVQGQNSGEEELFSTSSHQQKERRNNNILAISGGLALEAFNLRYSRIFNISDRRFVDVEIGGGRGLALVRQSASGGISLNLGHDEHYLCVGAHYTYSKIDFFGEETFCAPSLSVGYHFRANAGVDLRLRGHAYKFEDLGYPLPGVQMAIGFSF